MQSKQSTYIPLVAGLPLVATVAGEHCEYVFVQIPMQTNKIEIRVFMTVNFSLYEVRNKISNTKSNIK